MKKFLVVLLFGILSANDMRVCKQLLDKGYNLVCIGERTFIERTVEVNKREKDYNQYSNGIGIGAGVGYGITYVGALCSCNNDGTVKIK